jgi:asparagine synthase (glutamine-hydrolysing)
VRTSFPVRAATSPRCGAARAPELPHKSAYAIMRRFLDILWGGALHLYAIASEIPALTEDRLRAEVIRAGELFGLDPATAWTAASDGAGIVAAGVHHPLDRCGRRRYLARSDSKVTWFDGLPVPCDDRLDGADAQALAGHWETLDGRLEGQFNVAQLDLRTESAEVLLDALGLLQVFVARAGRGTLLTNSVGLIASILGLRSPDALGVSSFLALGWAAGDSTLVRGVRVLGGGSRHTLSAAGLNSSRSFGPQSIPLRQRQAPTATELARTLATLTATAVRGNERVGCALTAGRDSRVLAALLQSTGEHALYFTGGRSDDADVVIACEIAQMLGLEHEVVYRDPASASLDWTDAAARFVAQNDGLVSLLQLPDYIDLTVERPPLGVKLGGVGGEIGRAGTGDLTAIAANVPLARNSVRVQRKLLSMKVRNDAGLMTDEASSEAGRYLDRFREERLGEGWRPHELQEAFYTFERVGRWGASGRRLAGTDDGFLPFCSRPYVDYCFSLRPAERLVEAPHYRLLSELSPVLRDHRFDFPMPAQRPWLAPLLATGSLIRAAWEHLAPTTSSSNGDGPPAVAKPEYSFQHAWFEERLELMRELFFSSHSDLWTFISRPRLESLLKATPAERARHQEDLLRATTVFWHFHGRRP